MQLQLIDYQSTSAAGRDIDELRSSIDTNQSGLRKNDFPGVDIDTWIGRVAGLEDIELGSWQSRNNALAWLGLQQGTLLQNLESLKQQYGEQRIGIVMGSSTSSIDRTETAYTELDPEQTLAAMYQQPQVHNPGGPSLYVAHATGITGPSMTVNTACSSSAKVFACAARWLQTGIVDAVLVGGVDTLCGSVLYGFHALQLVSESQCAPFDQDRNGINLGEAAGYAIVTRIDHEGPSTGVRMVGYGESSDAHHMSHPHPEGLGARLAMQQALDMAGLAPDQVDYINLHGTASRANDLIEGQLISNLFPATARVSSTKAWMGHTLGAAGITEALIAVDALVRGVIPGSKNLRQLDTELDICISENNVDQACDVVMSNSFGFGGNNSCLAFVR